MEIRTDPSEVPNRPGDESPKADPRPVDRAKAARRSILLVEDDPGTHSALRKIFTRLGWEVHSAMTVSEGLAMLDLGPEGVVLDVMLPDGDGLEVLRKVRADRSGARVVVTTGIDDPGRLEEIRGLRPDALLRKPMAIDDLIHALGSKRAR